MIVKIHTKRQFLALYNNFDLPTLVIGSSGDLDLLNTFWILKDAGTGNCNSYELEGCRLSEKEYRVGELNNYEKRRSIKHKKYIKWMKEFNTTNPMPTAAEINHKQ